MGCHTWFYNRVDRTQQEAEQNVIDAFEDYILTLRDIIDNPSSDPDPYDATVEQFEYAIDIYRRKIDWIKRGNAPNAVWNYQHENNLTITRYYHNNLYIEVEDFHDIFRIGNYSETVLFNLKETLEFLKKNDTLIRYGDSQCINPEEQEAKKRMWIEVNREQNKEKAINKLKDFWEKYPEGLIDFG